MEKFWEIHDYSSQVMTDAPILEIALALSFHKIKIWNNEPAASTRELCWSCISCYESRVSMTAQLSGSSSSFFFVVWLWFCWVWVLSEHVWRDTKNTANCCGATEILLWNLSLKRFNIFLDTKKWICLSVNEVYPYHVLLCVCTQELRITKIGAI